MKAVKRGPSPLPLALAVLGLWAVSARAADGPPKLDIESTCKSSTRAQVSVSDRPSEEGCLQSERSAHDELKKSWSNYTPAAKTQCEKQYEAGGFPSYVEMVTCLELASGTVPSQTGGDAGGPKDAPGPKGSSLTREPTPAQRTNPIDVLRDK